MKSLVLQTDAPRQTELTAKRIFWTEITPRGIEVQSKIILETPRRALADMLVETEDGAEEIDVRGAIAAAALADDWLLAESLAMRYGLVVCLRCATDMQNRPGLRLFRLLGIRNCWGEVCGSCAVEMLELKG